ncbi:MAG: SPOR domain-containing protein [Betaproteobacteria bacterium]
MARLIFFLLLIANVSLGAYLYLNETKPKSDGPREINAGALKIVAVTDAARAQQEALTARAIASALSGSACVDFAVKQGDSARAQAAFSDMKLGNRLSSRITEEFSRFAVSLPAQKDKRTADTLVANLKKAGVKDVSALGDNAVSLGLFSSEDAAQKVVTDLKLKVPFLVKDLQVTPRSPQVKEVVFTIREPDTNMVARLTLMQRDFETSALRAVACPAATALPAPVESSGPNKK